MTSPNRQVGALVRQRILDPRKLTISEAANLLGISRVTLSRVLNGQSPLSPNVAARMENVFGLSAEELLNKQTQADLERQETASEKMCGFSYPFPVIKAHDLEAWAGTVTSRTELPVLIRRLIATTGTGITRCVFPGYDNGERHGWGGILETSQATQWVPEGLSVWELSTTSEVKTKANKDIKKRTRKSLQVDPSVATYIFVTLRVWKDEDKTAWLNEQKASKRWKDVRVYDAEDLERWLERSLETRIWLESRVSLPSEVRSDGVRPLDAAWNQWVNASDPGVNEPFFAEAVKEHQATLTAFLEDSQSNHLTVGAASVEEALAFLWCVMATDSLSVMRDQLLVFDKAEALQKRGQGCPTFIAVVHDAKTNAVCQTLNRQLKSIYICSAASVDETDIVLRPLSLRAINRLPAADKAVSESVGGRAVSLKELLLDCGASLTVLHRHLARYPEQRGANWSWDGVKAAWLIPAAMMGQWSETSDWQKQVLTQLMDTKNRDEFESNFKQYLKTSDAPVWQGGEFRGIVSKLDAFFSLRDELTAEVLDRFYRTTTVVLQQPDPQAKVATLTDLPVPIVSYDERLRQTRRQLLDTAAFLAKYGPRLVKNRFLYDFSQKGVVLMNALLQPLSIEKLQQIGTELPLLAETAPRRFLQLLEDDWTLQDSVIRRMLSEDKGKSEVRRTLLKALAVTAQLSEDEFMRTCRLLGVWQTFGLSDYEDQNDIDELLEALFTPSNVDVMEAENLPKALKWVVKTFPNAGRGLCLRLMALKDHLPEVLPSPQWNRVGLCEWTADEETTYLDQVGEFLMSVTKATELMGLLPLVRVMPEKTLRIVCERLETWLGQKPMDEAVADLKEVMRQQVDFRRLPEGVRRDLEAFYHRLNPQDIVQRCRWLFAKPWVAYAAGEIWDEDFNLQARDQAVESQRLEALKAIWATRGTNGLLELALYGEAQFVIGQLVSKLLNDEQWIDLLQSSLTKEADSKREALVRGLTVEVPSGRLTVMSRWAAILSQDSVLKLLRLMPFRRWVWQWMKSAVPQWTEAYWRTVSPVYVSEQDEALEAVEALLALNRPRAAFVVVQWQPKAVGAEVLLKILLALLKPSDDKCVVSGGHLKVAVKIVVQSSDIPRDTKAYLEFFYIDALRIYGSHRAEHIEALEAYIAEHPEFYVNLVGWVFKRNDGEPDEAVYRDTKTYAGISHRTLNAICLTETLEKEQSFERVRNWVNSVRRGCQVIGRGEVADILLGKLMARSFYDVERLQFPMNFYRLLTEVDSSDFVHGAVTEILNSRWLRWSSGEDSGDRERRMVEKIRQEMARIRYEWPRGIELLRMLEWRYMVEAGYHDNGGGERYRRSSSVG